MSNDNVDASSTERPQTVTEKEIVKFLKKQNEKRTTGDDFQDAVYGRDGLPLPKSRSARAFINRLKNSQTKDQ